jgi:hypothetical protein
MRSIIVLGATTVLAFFLTALIFDPEQRFILRSRTAKP